MWWMERGKPSGTNRKGAAGRKSKKFEEVAKNTVKQKGNQKLFKKR